MKNIGMVSHDEALPFSLKPRRSRRVLKRSVNCLEASHHTRSFTVPITLTHDLASPFISEAAMRGEKDVFVRRSFIKTNEATIQTGAKPLLMTSLPCPSFLCLHSEPLRCESSLHSNPGGKQSPQQPAALYRSSFHPADLKLKDGEERKAATVLSPFWTALRDAKERATKL